MATKKQGYTHCGVSAHARGIRKKNKAKVVVDAFYVPGGTILQKGVARPTAKIDPMILKRDAPRKYLRQLETGKLTTAEWKNLIIDARTHVEDSGGEDDEDTLGFGALSGPDRIPKDNNLPSHGAPRRAAAAGFRHSPALGPRGQRRANGREPGSS